MIEIRAEHGDDQSFTPKVNAIVRAIVANYAPPEIFVAKVDNWFGPRWLRFSGKVLGAVGLRKETLTLPPFVPKRVVWECRFVAPDYAQASIGTPLHIDTPGSQAVQRRISMIAPGRAFLWFSAGSQTNGKAAIMAYVPTGGTYWTWYVGWSCAQAWRPSLLKGISARELARLSSADE